MKENYKNIQELTAWLTKKEGKLSNIKIGDMRELISILSDEIYKNPKLLILLLSNGSRRTKKK